MRTQVMAPPVPSQQAQSIATAPIFSIQDMSNFIAQQQRLLPVSESQHAQTPQVPQLALQGPIPNFQGGGTATVSNGAPTITPTNQ